MNIDNNDPMQTGFETPMERNAVLSSDWNPKKPELAEIIDVSATQLLLEDFYRIVRLPTAIIDRLGNVIVGVGWQEACTRFHRVNAKSSRSCMESDTLLSAGVKPGEFRLYKCRNNLCDVATPLMIGERHVGNVFAGQFFLEEERVDLDLFRAQARRYGFDEREYLRAIEAVPRLSRNAVETAVAFLVHLAQILSHLGHSNMMLARSLSDRDALAETLKKKEDSMNRAQEIAHLGSWELDLPEDHLVWSDEVYRMFGLRPGEFAATYEAFLEAVHPEDREAVNAAYEGSLKEGRDSYEIEHRIVRKSTGEVRTVHEKCEHLRDKAGRVIKSIGMVHDITERKRGDEALRKAHDELEQKVLERTAELRNTNTLLKLFSTERNKKEYLDEVVKLLGEWTGCEAIGVRVLNDAGDIPYGSYTGFTRQFWESENLLSIHSDQCICTRVAAGALEPHDMAFITKGKSFHCDDTAQLISGLSDEAKKRFRGMCMASGYASVTVIPVSYRGKTLGAIHLADSVKGRVSAETVEFLESVQPLIGEAMHRFDLEEDRERLVQQLLQAQKMEALGTATGGIAHDFNNILAAVVGFAELVRGRLPAGSREARLLVRVVEAGVRGRELIKQMLTFARKTDHEKKPVRLTDIVRETFALLRASVPTTIDLKVNVRSESGIIMGDENQIQQVLMNLCTNAAHAMREKGGTLEIELSDFSVRSGDRARGMKPGLYMKLSVRDTGVGVPAEHRGRIFDPFFTTKEIGQGTGLGLSVVHGIVKQHEGYVMFESEDGKGSVFDVYLPKANIVRPSEGPAETAIQGGSEHILFVDDEEALVEMGQEILEELGYHVTVTRSSPEALAAFAADPEKFDLMITDQTMPEMTGFELARRTMGIRPDMPIILCTGFSHAVNGETARQAGIRAMVAKPLTKREIAAAVRRVLDGA